MRKRNYNLGLIERLKQATSESEVKSLLKEGAKYPGAAAGTRARWGRVADRKLASFLLKS